MPNRKSGEPIKAGAILKWIRKREEEMTRLVAELVAIPSENPPGTNYQAATKTLEKHMRRSGLDLQRLKDKSKAISSKEAPVCLLGEYGNGVRTLYFHGHYDVVPAQAA